MSSTEPVQSTPTFDELTHAIGAIEQIVESWETPQQQTLSALRTAIDDLHREAFKKLISACQPAADAELRALLQDEVVYGVLRHLEIVRPSLQERIESALDSVRPMLASHGGDVELVEVLPPDTVKIRLLGACDGCPASGLTLSEGVEKAIQEACPEIADIRLANGFSKLSSSDETSPIKFISPFAQQDNVDWQFAAYVHEVPQDGIKLAAVAGRSVILSRTQNTFVCYEDVCAHMGMPLGGGLIENGQLECPHHGLRFLLSTGECTTIKEIQLKTLDVRVCNNVVEVNPT